MEKDSLTLLSDMIEKINSIEISEDTKVCLLGMCEEMQEKIKTEALKYDIKFIETTIREFGYCLTDEINHRYQKTVEICYKILKKNEQLECDIVSKNLENLLLKRDFENMSTVNISREMQDAYEHMQKVKSGELHYRKDIKDDDIAMLYKQGKGATKIGKELKCSRQTVINRLKGMNLWKNHM